MIERSATIDFLTRKERDRKDILLFAIEMLTNAALQDENPRAWQVALQEVRSMAQTALNE